VFENNHVTATLAAPPIVLPPLGPGEPSPAVPALVGVPAGQRDTPELAATQLSQPGPAQPRPWQRQPEGPPPVLPVLPELAALLPAGGLRRGSTVAVTTGSSLLLALLAKASQEGSWCAVVGWPELGGLAAAELGVALERMVAVPDPGTQWLDVTAALLDGADLVVARPPPGAEPRDLRRLAARARERKSVLLSAGDWPGAELRLSIVDSMWAGLEQGAGHLMARQITVRVEGRGAASRPREGRIDFRHGMASEQPASEAVA
jgi:hypothetical protein